MCNELESGGDGVADTDLTSNLHCRLLQTYRSLSSLVSGNLHAELVLARGARLGQGVTSIAEGSPEGAKSATIALQGWALGD